MLIPRDLKIVDKLAKLCEKNPVQLRCKHVAALVSRNTIVSLGMNKAKSDPGFFELSKDRRKQYVHAEWDCLNGIENAHKYTMYVVRVDKNGQLANSKPCKICQQAIDGAGIKRVVHSTNRGIAVL